MLSIGYGAVQHEKLEDSKGAVLDLKVDLQNVQRLQDLRHCIVSLGGFIRPPGSNSKVRVGTPVGHLLDTFQWS